MNRYMAKMEYIVLLCFLLVPFAFLSSGPATSKIPYIHIGQHYAFVLSALAIIAVLIKNRFISTFFIYSIAWMVFIFIYKVVYYAFIPPQVVGAALDQIIYFLAGAVVLYAVMQSKIKNETFYNAICSLSLIQCILSLSQKLGFDPVLWILNKVVMAIPLLSPSTLTGTLGNPNFLAAFVAISIPFFFRRNWYYSFILIIPVLYLANTTSALIPAIIGTVYFFWPKISRMRIDEKIAVVMIGVLIAAWYALFNYNPAFGTVPFYKSPRWQYWQEAIGQLFIYPVYVITGMGPGAGWGKPFPLHSEWVQCLHQYGLIGLSLLAGYVVTVYRENRILFTAFMIATINMFGNYALHLAPSAFLIILIVGMIERERNETS